MPSSGAVSATDGLFPSYFVQRGGGVERTRSTRIPPNPEPNRDGETRLHTDGASSCECSVV